MQGYGLPRFRKRNLAMTEGGAMTEVVGAIMGVERARGWGFKGVRGTLRK